MAKLEFNEERANKALGDLIEVFQKHKMTTGEILIVYGNLGYALGASIDGYTDKGPSIEDLKRLYYSNPTLGVALMLQGATVTTWFDNWAKQYQDTKKEG